MRAESSPALSSRPAHARNSHARVAFNESLARRCADHRAKKAEDHGYLFYSAHSGWRRTTASSSASPWGSAGEGGA